MLAIPRRKIGIDLWVAKAPRSGVPSTPLSERARQRHCGHCLFRSPCNRLTGWGAIWCPGCKVPKWEIDQDVALRKKSLQMLAHREHRHESFCFYFIFASFLRCNGIDIIENDQNALNLILYDKFKTCFLQQVHVIFHVLFSVFVIFILYYIIDIILQILYYRYYIIDIIYVHL